MCQSNKKKKPQKTKKSTPEDFCRAIFVFNEAPDFLKSE